MKTKKKKFGLSRKEQELLLWMFKKVKKKIRRPSVKERLKNLSKFDKIWLNGLYRKEIVESGIIQENRISKALDNLIKHQLVVKVPHNGDVSLFIDGHNPGDDELMHRNQHAIEGYDRGMAKVGPWNGNHTKVKFIEKDGKLFMKEAMVPKDMYNMAFRSKFVYRFHMHGWLLATLLEQANKKK